MNKNKKLIILGFIAVIIIISVSFLFWLIIYIPNQVVKEFGYPVKGLSISQSLTFPLELFNGKEELLKPMGGVNVEEQFEIPTGESVSLVCLRLEQEGLISSAELFRIYLIYTGLDRQIQTGIFTLNSAMSQVEIAQALIDPLSTDTWFSILPGWRIEEIAQTLPTSGLSISPEAFIDMAYHPASSIGIQVSDDGLESLEGFLYPDAYRVSREMDLAELFELVLTRFNEVIDQDLRDAFTRQGLSLNEAVTMASIIEREAVIDEEKPLIASVFYNRLIVGMRLETDPTIQYAISYYAPLNTWWKAPLDRNDLQIESAYNTYLNYGLPPGPISNPSLASLRAVAYPAETPYYFFRAACDDSQTHNFSVTYEEHLANECPQSEH
ncbi:MAG: endolytic transglycosylase MltG [Chloroflexota bacterium]